METAKKQSLSTQWGTAENAPALDRRVALFTSDLRKQLLGASWWIRDTALSVAAQADEEYRECVTMIIDSHGHSRCEGLRDGLSCSICNIKHGYIGFGRYVKKMGDEVRDNPVWKVTKEPVKDPGFDPVEDQREQLARLAERVLDDWSRKYDEETDKFLEAHMRHYDGKF